MQKMFTDTSVGDCCKYIEKKQSEDKLYKQLTSHRLCACSR